MAAQFAKEAGARMLLLNHFSSRYKGDADPASLSVMHEIGQQAAAAYGEGVTVCDSEPLEQQFRAGSVLCTRDFMRVTIPVPRG